MGLVVAPIVEGKQEAFRSWLDELKGSRKAEFDELNKRYGLTRHDVWLVESPKGDMAVVLQEGPGADSFMQKVGHADNGFDLEMKQHLEEIHGMKMDQPPPGPMPVKLL
jgi:hypothetical protein